MDFFVDSIAIEMYNKIVDVLGDELEPDVYGAIEATIDLGCKIIWRYMQQKNVSIKDEIDILKRKIEKEVEK